MFKACKIFFFRTLCQEEETDKFENLSDIKWVIGCGRVGPAGVVFVISVKVV